jgi:hypothetical protein
VAWTPSASSTFPTRATCSTNGNTMPKAGQMRGKQQREGLVQVNGRAKSQQNAM